MDDGLSADLIRDRLLYDSTTGKFVWRTGRRSGKPVGYLNSKGYIIIAIGGKNKLAHRLAWFHFHGRAPDGFIDHINGDTADNRIVNLREADVCQNGYNRKIGANNKSGRVGVHFIECMRKFRVDIKVARKRIIVGNFENYADACAARDAAEREHFREFRRTL